MQSLVMQDRELAVERKWFIFPELRLAVSTYKAVRCFRQEISAKDSSVPPFMNILARKQNSEIVSWSRLRLVYV